MGKPLYTPLLLTLFCRVPLFAATPNFDPFPPLPKEKPLPTKEVLNDALIDAVRNSNTIRVTSLIKLGAKINTKVRSQENNYTESLLSIATSNVDIEMIRYLKYMGAK